MKLSHCPLVSLFSLARPRRVSPSLLVDVDDVAIFGVDEVAATRRRRREPT
jgi:hypothetical protein